MACVFCQIASGKVPTEFLHQDDQIVAFKDIAPRAPFHALVIPRQHIASLADAEDATLVGRLGLIAVKLAREAGYAERGFRVVTNSGPDAGQGVDHLHFHVLAGRAMAWPPG